MRASVSQGGQILLSTDFVGKWDPLWARQNHYFALSLGSVPLQHMPYLTLPLTSVVPESLRFRHFGDPFTVSTDQPDPIEVWWRLQDGARDAADEADAAAAAADAVGMASYYDLVPEEEAENPLSKFCEDEVGTPTPALVLECLGHLSRQLEIGYRAAEEQLVVLQVTGDWNPARVE